MKRILFYLVVGVLFIAATTYAADGDVTVNGKLIAEGVIAQVISVSPHLNTTDDVTCTGTSFSDMPGMSVTVDTTASNRNSTLLIFWNTGSLLVGSSPNWLITEAILNSTTRVGVAQAGGLSAASSVDSIGGHAVTSVPPGIHTIKIRWKVTGGIAYSYPNASPDFYGRILTVMVIRQ
jgi:hypothetical protein